MDRNMILATWRTWVPHAVVLYSTWVLLNWFIVRPPFTTRGIVHHLLAVTLPLLFIPSVAALLWLFVDLDGEVAIWTALATLFGYQWCRTLYCVALVAPRTGCFNMAYSWRECYCRQHHCCVPATGPAGTPTYANSYSRRVHGSVLVWLYPKTRADDQQDQQDGPAQLQHTRTS